MLTALLRMSGATRSNIQTVLLVFAYVFGTASAYVLHRSVANSLFLVHIGVEYLPSMYILSAVLVVVSSITYGWAARRFRLDLVIRGTLLFTATAVLSMRLVYDGSGSAAATVVAFFIVNELRGNLNTIQFSTLANELFSNTEPKQILGFLGAGATLAGVTFGTLLGFFVDEISTRNLLYLIVAIDLLTILPVYILARSSQRKRLLSSGLAARTGSLFQRPFAGLQVAARSPLARGVAIVLMLGVMVNLLVEYEWQLAASQAFASDADALTSFFGFYYAVVYISIGLLQLTLSGWYLSRFGIQVGLLTQPMVLLGTLSFNLVMTGGASVLWAFTLVKGCEIFKRTVNDPVLQLAYWPLDGISRRQAIAFNSGVVKPVSEAVAAFILMNLRQILSGPQIVYWAVALVCIWALAALRCRMHYVNTLNDAISLGHHVGLHFDREPSPSTVHYLEGLLDSTNPNQIVNSLEILRSLAPQYRTARSGQLALLQLYHYAADVRKSVLDYLALTDDPRFAPHVQHLFRDGDLEVRIAAARTYCRLLRDASLPALKPLLEDPEPALVAAVLISLNQWAPRAARPLLEEQLERLFKQGHPLLRCAAVEVFASSSQADVLTIWQELLADQDPSVVRATLHAAGRIRPAGFVPALVDKLRDPGAAAAVVQALVRYRGIALPKLASVLKDPQSSAPWRQEVVRVLKHISTPGSLELSVQTLHDEDEDVLGEALRSIHKLVRVDGLELSEQAQAELHTTFRNEVQQFYQRLRESADLNDRCEATLLQQGLEDLRTKSIERVLLCLAVLQPGWDYSAMAFSLRSRGTRVQLLGRELLANSLAGDLAPAVLAMVSDRPRDEVLAIGQKWFSLERCPLDERLRRLVYDRNDWIKTVAIQQIAEHRFTHLIADVEAALEDQAYMVRETALLMLAKLQSPGAFRETAAKMRDDLDSRIAAQAQSHLLQLL